MNKTLKNLFYASSFGMSSITILWIVLAKRSTVFIPVDIGLIFMYFLLVSAFVSVVFLGVRELIQKPKSAKIVLLSIIVLTLLVLIGFIIDDAEVLNKYSKYGVTTNLKSRIIGGSLIATWIVLGGAILLALLSSILDFFKR